jgi:hypothetical protein
MRLAMEREEMLDHYFDNLVAQKIEKSSVGWESIQGKPSLRKQVWK